MTQYSGFTLKTRLSIIVRIPWFTKRPIAWIAQLSASSEGPRAQRCLAIPSRAGVLNDTVDRAGTSNDAEDARIPANMAVII